MAAEKILIVDDIKENIVLLKEFLLEEDYQILTALNGDEALNIIRSQEVDLVLLDVLMPGIDGFEVCRKIKFEEGLNHLPVVMVTALNAREDRLKGLKAGADDFLTKPIDWAELIVRVRSLLRLKKTYDLLEDQLNRLENQLKMARGVQQELVEVDMPPGLKGEILYLPAENVGGDVFDLIQLEENSYGFFIADSSGHGVPAALVMVMIKLLFRELDVKNLTPGDVLASINNRLTAYFNQSNQQIFATGLYLIVDLEKSVIEWANGGHPYPLLIDGEGSYHELLPGDMPLGIMKDYTYHTHKIDLKKNNSLFFYTDGLADFFQEGESSLREEDIQTILEELMKKKGGHSSLYERIIQESYLNTDDDICFAYIKNL